MDEELASAQTLRYAEEFRDLYAAEQAQRRRAEEALARLARAVVGCHHERYDGSGNPGGLRGEETPLSARIFALADAYDAMTSERPYRPALPAERALAEIAAGAGSQFDPALAEDFLLLVGRARPPLPAA